MERRLILRAAGGLGVAALLAPFAGRAAPPATVPAALNKAGRQRMLVQRASKAWLMLGLGTVPPRARALLAESTAAFEAQHAELGAYTPNESVAPALARTARAWGHYRELLAMPATRALAPEIYRASEVSQDAAHPLTLAYERSARTPAERLVNVAGRQRMLSQRMAKLHLFRVWDVNRSAASMELNWARAEFSSGMHHLYNAAGDIPGAGTPLAELDHQWLRFRDALGLDRPEAPPAALAEVVESSERILAVTEQLVALFEQHALRLST